MKSKILHICILVTISIVFSGCDSLYSFSSNVPMNGTSTHVVELVGDHSETIEGTYLLRFDNFNGKYMTIKKEAENLLLEQWQVKAPSSIHILERNATVRSIEHDQTQAYEIKTSLKIAAVPEVAALQNTYNIAATFPAALTIAKMLKPDKPYIVPEINFHVLHYAKSSDRASDRIGRDSLFTALCMIASYIMFRYGYPTPMLPLLAFGGLLYYGFLSLRDLWWFIVP
ncbi:MAG: hypothetical protein DM484_00525 [Candidatus Methylumidiphilus alinenensis]|uniref:Uncharacterized protein n=1 Tax=Candidatus Methylumidiphilus alinenensis TaxID=2202197 RepID=A0A2W4TY93_9GAMM|nr:MAG: hypothetical protein DM484_00525 [Candidatus Methylumidiphilus alinenensis]